VKEDTEVEEALMMDIVEIMDTWHLVKSVVMSAASLDAGQSGIQRKRDNKRIRDFDNTLNIR
jgi:hypothetical protein